MNKVRRNQLEEIAENLESLQGDLYMIMNEEEDYYGNMPKSIRSGKKGEASRSVIDLLGEAGCAFDELADTIRAAAE